MATGRITVDALTKALPRETHGKGCDAWRGVCAGVGWNIVGGCVASPCACLTKSVG